MAQNSQPVLLITLAFFGALLFSGVSTTTTSHNDDTLIGVSTWDAEKQYLHDDLLETPSRARAQVDDCGSRSWHFTYL
ncbi:hypothetical protein Tco_1189933 [Tanacetum coccineum]|uniref:Uncharacterized protein n=1 Tax=Tanacetum coccineum TaxID=301880 RepID=A0ABQ5DRC5_9ASTR